jgi:hypothetical protein
VSEHLRRTSSRTYCWERLEPPSWGKYDGCFRAKDSSDSGRKGFPALPGLRGALRPGLNRSAESTSGQAYTEKRRCSHRA